MRGAEKNQPGGMRNETALCPAPVPQTENRKNSRGEIIEEAKKIGYAWMRLDTVPSMKSARALYETLGFKKIPPYRHNPIAGAVFLELKLGISSPIHHS